MVRWWYALGTLEVRSWYARGVLVALSTVLLPFGTLTFFLTDTVHVQRPLSNMSVIEK